MIEIVKYPEPGSVIGTLRTKSAGPDPEVCRTVSEILSGIRSGGDEKLLSYVRTLDGYDAAAGGLEVTEAEFSEAETLVDEELKKSIAAAKENIRKFHAAQQPEDVFVETMPGVVCCQKNIPVSRVGLYVPGGTAPLFSTVLMLAVPAGIAGCREIILCTPPAPDGHVSPVILYCAKVCGVGRVFKIGGAVAIAAMAYGTETVSRVDKIFGPGNAYVTAAKQMVSGVCAIDMPAGPSEVMILADDSARAEYVCSDFLSQMEHGRDSQAVLVTNSERLAFAVAEEFDRQLSRLKRKGFIEQSSEKSKIIVVKTEEEMTEISNMYAPEHLIICTENYRRTLERITSAGSVFLGNYSPESAGDYASGTNHTLPTGGWAVSCSGVNLSSYFKKMTVQEISRDGLAGLAPVIRNMAMAEGLDAHARAVDIRLEK